MRYKCIVSYDGFNFNGYQIQKHDKNTIQEKIQDALKVIFKEEITIFASGRTDKAVHAIKQVFHFDSTIKIPNNNLKTALNNNLPIAIRIKKISKVNQDFHARYSAHKKIYEYKIINTIDTNPFNNRYVSYIKEKIDINLLEEASKLLIGTHDFESFTTNKKSEIDSFVKEIYDIKIKKVGNKINITFYGSGFLKYQVRMMVGALIAISTNKVDKSYIIDCLEKKKHCSYKAAPQGLYLKEVIY